MAVSRTYLLPPLSSGGASLVRPWLRFHTPLIGRVEDWRAGLEAEAFQPRHVSSPLRIERSVGSPTSGARRMPVEVVQ